jgi:hypothetical protein
MPRTREANREDFQTWLNGYISKYGERALTKTTRAEKDFLDVYRPFRDPIFEGRVTRDLRTSTSDIMLIPGYGASSIAIIESEGTIVKRALPHANDRHAVYTLRTNPETWFGQIRIPKDVHRPSLDLLTS